MRRLLTLVVRVVLMIGLLAAVRQVLLDRSPQKAFDGTRPVIGSLDTWPAVPRRPTG
jgi:hypothetical protein